MNPLACIKPLIRSGSVTTFSGIFKHVPPSLVAKSLGMNYHRLKGMIDQPGKVDVETCYRLGELFGVKGKKILEMAGREVANQKAR